MNFNFRTSVLSATAALSTTAALSATSALSATAAHFPTLASTFKAGLLLVVLTIGPGCLAATLNLTLTDQHGTPVEDAVMYVRSIDGSIPPSSPMQVDVDQIDEAFVPHVRAATAGSLVNFPNSDHVRHHVYSFSKAKTFEVPLYSGVPSAPTLFDQAGLVTLGCNIHDHMLGYILILDTPYFSEIRAGKGSIATLPAGELVVEIWHPRLLDAGVITQLLQATADAELNLELQVTLRPERMVRRAPRRSGSRY